MRHIHHVWMLKYTLCCMIDTVCAFTAATGSNEDNEVEGWKEFFLNVCRLRREKNLSKSERLEMKGFLFTEVDFNKKISKDEFYHFDFMYATFCCVCVVAGLSNLFPLYVIIHHLSRNDLSSPPSLSLPLSFSLFRNDLCRNNLFPLLPCLSLSGNDLSLETTSLSLSFHTRNTRKSDCTFSGCNFPEGVTANAVRARYGSSVFENDSRLPFRVSVVAIAIAIKGWRIGSGVCCCWCC